MVWPSTKCEPSSRIACRVAARTAGRPSRLTQCLDDALRRLARMDDARRQRRASRPRPRPAGAVDRVSVAAPSRRPASLSSISRSAVRGVGHAQQRLGQHHQGQPFLGGERVGVQEVLDAAEPAGAGADRLDQAGGAGIDARLGLASRAAAASRPAAIPRPAAHRAPRRTEHRALRRPAAARMARASKLRRQCNPTVRFSGGLRLDSVRPREVSHVAKQCPSIARSWLALCKGMVFAALEQHDQPVETPDAETAATTRISG